MTLYESAQQVGEVLGVNPDFIYAQWAHESAYGTSQLAREDNNFGGVKNTDGSYMHFDSMEDWTDYMSRYLNNYEGLAGSQDIDSYIGALQAGGYATDPDYFGKVKEMYNEVAGENGGQYSDDYSWDSLDMSVLTSNHPDDNYSTNLTDLRPETIHGLNVIGNYFNDMYNAMTIITGGAETWTHEAGEYSHHTGWKADIVVKGVTDKTEAGQAFIEFAHRNGWSVNYEDNHWDIDFSGNDSRDYQGGAGEWQLVGNGLANFSFGDTILDSHYNYPDYHATPSHNNDSVLGAMATNFWDSLATSTIGGIGRWVYDDFVYGGWGNHTYDPKRGTYIAQLSDEDVAFIEESLPNDKEAQDFIKLHGASSEMVHAWVRQHNEDKKRQEEIQQWKAGNESLIASVAVGLAGAGGVIAGEAVNPINWIPVAGAVSKGTRGLNLIGRAIKGEQLVNRLGEAIHNVDKAKWVADLASKTIVNGAIASGTVTADNFIKEKTSGRKADYGMDAMVSFFAGGLIGGALGKWIDHKEGTLLRKVTEKADHAETVALMEATDVDMDTLKFIRSETKGDMLPLHDKTYSSLVKSTKYSRMVKDEKLIATTSDKAKEVVAKFGKVLPDDARAFYVPNEDYVVLLTDRIKASKKKDLKETVDSLIAHEVDVHSNLRKSLGDDGYKKLMDKVSTESTKIGSNYHKARQAVGTDDPEEIWAYMVENNMIGKHGWGKIKDMYNGILRDMRNFRAEFTTNEVKEIFTEQNKNRYMENYVVNEDGSTAFAGMRFSRDNIVNPHNLANYYEQENIANITQADLMTGIKPIDKATKEIGKQLEAGWFFGTVAGKTLNSLSNRMRKYAGDLFDDARGRGYQTMAQTAETQKKRIIGQLNKPIDKFMDVRSRYLANNTHKYIGRDGAMAEFNEMCVKRYNEIYGGHTADPLEFVPDEVEEAVQHMKAYRDMMIDIGKRTASDMGLEVDNMIDKDWYSVDDEFFRWIDDDKRNQFLRGHFFAEHGNNKTDEEQAIAYLTNYFYKASKREVVREKIKRERVMANNRINVKNDKIKAKKGDTVTEEDLIPLQDTNVTDVEVQAWLDKHIPMAVKQIISGIFDPSNAKFLDTKHGGNLGHLNYFKVRVPIDTSMRLPIGKNGETFALDDLRNYDLDNIFMKTTNRFAGESAVKNVFGTQGKLDYELGKIKGELDMAVLNHDLNRGDADNLMKTFEQSINELRGVRPADESAIGQAQAVARIAGSLAYSAKGANMGWNQFGEMSGTIAYGGVQQIFNAFKPLADFVDKVSYGKDSAELLCEAENEIFGANMEKRIWSKTTKDRVIAEALTQESRLNRGLKAVADKAQWLGKITSSVNMLPHMTDTMTRGMRRQYMVDSIMDAHGIFKSKLRQPFSDAKLKASDVSKERWTEIKESLKAHTEVDDRGHIQAFNFEKWQEDDPMAYAQWYDLCQKQADRAITSANSIGNKNVLKNKNQFNQMLFQFKDYTLRSMNVQTMRALTSRDLDDGLAAMASIVTNTMTYAMRAGALYGMYKMYGLDKEAEEYRQRSFDDDNMLRAVATRSAFVGTPLSFANDFLEATMGLQSIRTTVNRDGGKTYQKDRDISDMVGDMVAQLPAVQELSIPFYMYQLYKKSSEDKVKQRDVKNLLNNMPMGNFIPMTVLSQYLMNQQDIKTTNSKRSNKKKKE